MTGELSGKDSSTPSCIATTPGWAPFTFALMKMV
jgi:hypothetical protein